MGRPARELALALFLLIAAWIHPTHPANTEVRGVTLESIYPEVGTAHSFTSVTLYGEGRVKNLPTLGCRFGEVVSTYQAHVPGLCPNLVLFWMLMSLVLRSLHMHVCQNTHMANSCRTSPAAIKKTRRSAAI